MINIGVSNFLEALFYISVIHSFSIPEKRRVEATHTLSTSGLLRRKVTRLFVNRDTVDHDLRERDRQEHRWLGGRVVSVLSIHEYFL